jgi:Ca2+-binding RTX toxin-like protein
MTLPVADPVEGQSWEDSVVFITLTAADAEDGAGTPLSFRLGGLPLHGAIYTDHPDWGGVAVSLDEVYAAAYYDDGSGAWSLSFVFVPDPDWSGVASFDYVAIDSEGGVSTAATATLTIDPTADAPVIDAGVNDQPIADAAATQVTATTTAEDSPQLAAFGDGRSLMVWQQGLTTGQVMGRIIGSDGQFEGAAFAVTPSGRPSEISPALAAHANGAFASAWVEDDASGPSPGTRGGGDIRAAFFAPGATTPAAVATVAASGDAREAGPTVVAAGDGYVVTWAEEAPSTARIMAQRYDAAGASVGPAVELTDVAAKGFNSGVFFDPPSHAAAAVGAEGAIAVAFTDGADVRAVVMDAAGQVTAAIDVSMGSGQGDPAITALPDGGFAVAWTGEDQNTGNSVIDARLFDADGAPRTAVLTLAAEAFASAFVPAIGALPDGRLAVAWIGSNGVDSSYDIFTAVFAADGTPTNGGAVAVTRTGLPPSGPQVAISEVQPTLTVSSDGTYSVGWLQSRATGGTNPDVFVRTYDPGLGAVDGVSGFDLTLPTTIATGDTDGSEVISRVVISGLPAGFSLDHGAREGGDPQGDWVIERSTDAAFIDGLADGSERLVIHTVDGVSGDLQIQVWATCAETGDPSQTADSGTVVIPLRLVHDDPPMASAGATTGYTEQAGPVAIDSGLTLGDPDSPTLAGATVAITASLTAGDVLAFASQAGITGAYDAATGVLTLQGEASVADYQAALRGVTFASDSDDPTSNGAARTISWQVDDGYKSSALVTSTVQVTAVNDAPVVSGQLSLTGSEDAPALVLDLLSNATDPEGGALAVDGLSWSSDAAWLQTLPYSVAGGVLTLDTQPFNRLSAGESVTITLSYRVADPEDGEAETQAIIVVEGRNETVMGTARDDALDGSQWADDVFGLDGDDVLDGLDGDDRLDGGAGDDVLNGGSGNDRFDDALGANTLAGGSGDDWFVDHAADEAIDGGSGIDTVDFSGLGGDGVRADLALGERQDAAAAGMDSFAGVENLLGSDGDDTLLGSGAANTLSGANGADLLAGRGGEDSLAGGGGGDTLQGGAGADTVDGGAGLDTASYAGSRGGVKVSLVRATAQGGDAAGDLLKGIESLTGSSWGDRLTGEVHANTLLGGTGNDKLIGGGGDDVLDGGPGRDLIKGGAGRDLIRAGWDGDVLNGGLDGDTFAFAAPGAGDLGRAMIRDLEAQDVIDLSAIDADPGKDGDQRFRLVDEFTGKPGQATFAYDAGAHATLLSLDIDGDGHADLALEMAGDQTGFGGLVL